MSAKSWAMETVAEGLDLSQFEADAIPGGCLVQIYPAGTRNGLFDLVEPETIIGRDPSTHFQLHSESVSRQHAVIRADDKGFVLLDPGSTNGTYVNDVRVVEHRLRAGDQIRIGDCILKFLSSNDIEAQYHETVYTMMTRDTLTTAWNRRYMTDVLQRELARSRRYSRPLALVLLDIDHFKRVNDKFGHLTGDAILLGLCTRMQSLLRQDNVLARYGGEEFAVVLSEASLSDARRVAERLRKAVMNAPFDTEAGRIRVTISVGVAQTDGDDKWSPEDMLREADERLYEAKQNGRNCVRY